LILVVAASAVTICPALIIALSSAVGTVPASQVEPVFQLPVTTDIKVPGALEINSISSRADGGLAIVLPSLFHENINL